MADEEQQPAQPPQIPPRVAAGNLPVPIQTLRIPPVYNPEAHDLNIYLRRFESYCDGLHAHDNDRVHILMSLLPDETLSAIERHIRQDITYAEISNILRHEEGLDNPNREGYITTLRCRRRTKGEHIRKFYHALYKLAKSAYPNDRNQQNIALRECFIGGLNDGNISARLRENVNLGVEELLDLAITLESCRNPTGKIEVNYVDKPTPTIEEQGEQGEVTNEKLNAIIHMIGNIQLNMEELSKDQEPGLSSETPGEEPQPLHQQQSDVYIGPNQAEGLQNPRSEHCPRCYFQIGSQPPW